MTAKPITVVPMPEFVARLREVASRQFRELADGDRELLREAADRIERAEASRRRVMLGGGL